MKKPKITVVDYGIGNLLSVSRALEAGGAAVVMAESCEEILSAEKLLLPGVGAFADCMDELKKREFVKPLQDYFASNKPFLGICVGMQVMFEKGEEFGDFEGLGLVPGTVSKIPENTIDGEALKVPHIGWSEVLPGTISWDGSILEGLKPGDSAYFLHSYAGVAPESIRLACANFGGHKILAAVAKNKAFGVQFHPERSGPVGLKILSNFIKL